MRICARVSLRVYVAGFFDWDDFSVRVRVVGFEKTKSKGVEALFEALLRPY